jgi:hypothetical protein
VGGSGVEAGGDGGSEAGALGVVGGGEGLLGEGAIAVLASESLDTAAVAGSGVEAESFVPEPLVDSVLWALGPGAVGWAEEVVWDLLDGSAGPVHGETGGKGRAVEEKDED